jgi:antitoxin MazE
MATVRKWGNSLGIRVPKAIAEQANLSNGTQVDFDTSGGVLTIRPRRRRRYTLEKLLASARGPSPHRALDRDRRVGRELI